MPDYDWEKSEDLTRDPARLAEVLIGRTIVAVEDHLNPDDPNGSGAAGYIDLILDNGTRISVDAWGHDAWGPIMRHWPSGTWSAG